MNNLHERPIGSLYRARYLSRSRSQSNTNHFSQVLLTILLHIGLALLMRTFSVIATIHAIIVFVLGFWTALTMSDLKKIVPIALYIMGSEVLWRMNNADIFWEFGKYAISFLMLVALLKNRSFRNAGLPVLFFLFFVPSIFLTINELGLTDRARELISFNISGPLTASICMIFFYQIRGTSDEMKKWVWSAVYPIISILTISVYSTLTATNIYYGSESVFETSGGYGPNQVSAILGLGALLLIVMSIQMGKQTTRTVALLLALGLITQSFLTFSRGGIYNLVVGLAGALIILISKPSKFLKGFIILFIVLVIVGIIIFPTLERITSGALSERFTDTNLGTRELLVKADVKLFKANPVLGVGPGMASYYRVNSIFTAAHTEYTRILAEHGSFGVFGLLILAIILIKAFLDAPDVSSRAWMVALASWSLVEMTHSAMRVASIGFILGMAVMHWTSEAEKPIENDQPDFQNKSIRFRYKF